MKLQIVCALLVCLVFITGCDESNTAPDGSTLANLALDLPLVVMADEPFTVSITATREGGALFEETATVVLALDQGVISPANVSIDGGATEVEVTITGAAGATRLTASSGRAEVGFGPFRVDLAALPGDIGQPAREAVPTMLFLPLAEDYADDHPDYGDLAVSTTTLVIQLASGATVGEVNALITELGAGVAGGVSGAGILFLHLAEGGHAEVEVALALARSTSAVEIATVDVLIDNNLQPRPNGGAPAEWTWESIPEGGNWGLERIRMPQAWNLKPAVEKYGADVLTGVLDSEFWPGHPDLDVFWTFSLAHLDTHGTHVAGTIAARWNGEGVDGLNPFARLAITAPEYLGGTTVFGSRVSWGQTWISWINEMIETLPDLEIINISQGYNWGFVGIDTGQNIAARTIATTQGLLLHGLLEYLTTQGDVPLIICAAGNDSNYGFGTMEAIYASAMTNAALEHGNPHIIVVEAVENSPGAGAGECARADFSNLNGHLSAPGTNILSTVANGGYAALNGTSMAAPHVAGLAGYLLAVDHTLTHAELMELLTVNALAVTGGASARIDAFASTLDIDRLRDNERVLHMLADIDDGSPDGNQRTDPETGDDVTSEDLDSDGGIGDGNIDMSDFRRWRDWLLQVEEADGLALDGPSNHPKKDINGSGVVESGADENIFPRGDFNGDGFLDRENESYVPGAVGGMATDLAIMQFLFDDPDYDGGDLPGLIESADLAVELDLFFEEPSVAEVVVSIWEQDTENLVEQRILTSETPFTVFTLAYAEVGFEVTVEGRDEAEELQFYTEDLFLFSLGEDDYWQPNPLATGVIVEADFPDALEPGDSFVLTVRAGHLNEENEPAWEPGIDIALTVTGGWAAQTTGSTDEQGEFTTLVNFETEEEYPVLTIFVGATDQFGDETVLPIQIKPNWAILGPHDVRADAGVNFQQWYDFDTDRIYNQPNGSIAVAAHASGYAEYPEFTIEVNGSAACDTDWNLVFVDESLEQVVLNGTISSDATVTVSGGEFNFSHSHILGTVSMTLVVIAAGNPMLWTLSGTVAGMEYTGRITLNDYEYVEEFAGDINTGGILVGYTRFNITIVAEAPSFETVSGTETQLANADFQITLEFSSQ